MNNMEVCKANNMSALERCLKIRDKVFTCEKGVPKEIEVDEYDSLNEKCNHFLIEYKGADIGTIRGLYTSKTTIKIQRFCLLKEYRGLGLGKAVIAHIENYYKNIGVVKIEMDAKYNVAGFYEKCGYKIISDVFIEANIEHIKMMKEIL